MKKNPIIVISILLLILFSLTIFTLTHYTIEEYESKYFSIVYDTKWKILSKSNNRIKIINSKKSTIEIIGKEINYDKKITDEEIYVDLNNRFLRKNEFYKLINTADTIIGSKYYKANEFLYNSNDNQVLYVILKDGDKIIEVSYLSDKKYFDIDLDYFYEVVNTLEIR